MQRCRSWPGATNRHGRAPSASWRECFRTCCAAAAAPAAARRLLQTAAGVATGCTVLIWQWHELLSSAPRLLSCSAAAPWAAGRQQRRLARHRHHPAPQQTAFRPPAPVSRSCCCAGAARSRSAVRRLLMRRTRAGTSLTDAMARASERPAAGWKGGGALSEGEPAAEGAGSWVSGGGGDAGGGGGSRRQGSRRQGRQGHGAGWAASLGTAQGSQSRAWRRAAARVGACRAAQQVAGAPWREAQTPGSSQGAARERSDAEILEQQQQPALSNAAPRGVSGRRPTALQARLVAFAL